VISFEMGKRPLVQALAGSPTSVIGGLVDTVTKITLPGGEETRFEFGTDEKLLPTVGVSGGELGQTARTIAWNPGTGEMIKDGEWRYEIKPDENPRYNAAIGRKNAKGQNEFWHYDMQKGTDTIIYADKSRSTRTYFTSGVSTGRLRKTEITDSQGDTKTKKYIYDDKGNLVRLVINESGAKDKILDAIENASIKKLHANSEVILNESDKVKRSIYKDGKLFFQNVAVAGELFEIYYDSNGKARIYSRRDKKWLPDGQETLSILNQLVSTKI